MLELKLQGGFNPGDEDGDQASLYARLAAQGGERGPMVGLYLPAEASEYMAVAGPQGARAQRAGFWLGFMPADRYTTSGDSPAIVFRADLWFPIVSNRESELMGAAEKAARTGAPGREGTYFYVPVERIVSLDVTEEQLVGIASGL